MKRYLTFLLCALLCGGVLLTGCGEKPSVGGQTGGEVSYADALASGDYEAAYLALLAGDKEADPADAAKFLVVPVTLTADDPKGFNGSYTATFSYDDKGLLSKITIPKNGKEELVTFTYDDAGRVVKKTDDTGSEYTTTNTYNEKGLLIKQYTEYESGRKVTLDYVYDEAGKLQTETETVYSGYSSEPDPKITTYTYTYDAKGNEILRMRKEGYGECKTYDEKGRLSSKYELSDGEKRNIHIYTYDEQDRLIKEHYTSSLTDPDFDTEKTFAYDSNGTQYTVLYTDGGDSEKYTYQQTFDEAGRLTSYTYTERDDNEYRVYTYDTAGNMLKAENYKNGENNYTFTYAYNEFGFRTRERYETPDSYYEYTVTYAVKYYPNGAPEYTDYVRELNETDSLRYVF